MAMTRARMAVKLKKLGERYKKLVARQSALLEKSKRVEGPRKARLLRRSVRMKARLLKLMGRAKKLQLRLKSAPARVAPKSKAARPKRSATIKKKIVPKTETSASGKKWKVGPKKKSSRGSSQLRMEKVVSLRDLRDRAETDPRYKELIMVAASNLGGVATTFEGAWRALCDNANETSEDGVVDEVNFVRDIVEEKFSKMSAGAAKPTKAKASSIDPAMLDRIKQVAWQTWEYIAGDTLNMERETTGHDYVSRDLVIELVTDANRMAMFDKEVDAFLSAMDYKDVIKLMKKHVFTSARYE